MSYNIISKEMALDLLRKEGLPSKIDENWHYTNLIAKLPSSLIDDLQQQRSTSTSGIALSENLQNYSVLYDNTELYNDFINLYQVEEAFLAKNTIGQVNFCAFSSGYNITISESSLPKEIHEITRDLALGSHNGVVVNMLMGNKATIVERHISSCTAKRDISSFLTNVNLEENTFLNYIIFRDDSIQEAELQQINAVLAENSQLNLFILNIGNVSNLRRQELNIKLTGKNANFQLRCINLLQHSSHCDITMKVHHLVPETTSREIVRNVVKDNALGIFQGLIKVAQAAQKTEAKMSCNSLILSDEANFFAKPELEIFADDVICGHGVTIAPLSADNLLYLMTRGIPRSVACDLLVRAFTDELLLENEDLISIFSNLLGRLLDGE